MNVKELIDLLKKYPETHMVKAYEFSRELSCMYVDEAVDLIETETGCEELGNKEHGVLLRAKPYDERMAELASGSAGEIIA